MSQRVSGYARKKNDEYMTPAWVTEALVPHLPIEAGAKVYEPAAGTNKIVTVLRKAGFVVDFDDLKKGIDFLKCSVGERGHYDGYITNPPYGLAAEFIEHALHLSVAHGGCVAMLLRTDFDHAQTRSHLFAQHSAFAKKVVLTKRIVWFEGSTGSPSFNHAWFLWDWYHQGPPTIAYEPKITARITKP